MEFGQGPIDQQPIVEVRISSLSLADSPRLSGEDPEHVAVLAAVQTELPPIVVHRSTMRVIDGLHRVRVAKLRGQEFIAARFFAGTEADAFVLSVKLNIMHGLPLSMADRKRAAGRIIASHPQWSDRMVASAAGISAGTVAEVRRRVIGETGKASVRIGQDGRIRPVDGTEGRRLAGELITENPGLSLRQIARAAGISPETARDVRNRLRRGEDPLPSPRRKRLVTHGEGAGRRSAVVRELDQRRGEGRGRAITVERLKADPALRFTETGRNLLRLLNMHTIRAEDWERIINNVPPHCRDIVAQLARDCAETWTEIAVRMEHAVANAT